MTATVDPRAILDTPMPHNDAGAPTIGAYLVALAREVWRENEGFSGKRPFGNSGWEGEIYTALAAAGYIEATDHGGGDIEYDSGQEAIGDGLIYAALDALAAPAAAVADVATAENAGLNTGQLIRLETARLLLPQWDSMASRSGYGTVGSAEDFVADLLCLARAIETGVEPAPSQDGDGAAAERTETEGSGQ